MAQGRNIFTYGEAYVDNNILLVYGKSKAPAHKNYKFMINTKVRIKCTRKHQMA
jgi:hypothetical protein